MFQVLRRDLMRALRKKRPDLLPRLILHQDNAPAHTAAATMSTIQDLGFELLPHTPYSQTYHPVTSFCCPLMKSNLRGTHFDDVVSLSSAVLKVIADISSDRFDQSYISWVERWQKCIRCNGVYFEKE